MPTDAQVVRCPACGWWLAKVTSQRAQVEVNCTNWNCKASVVITRDDGAVSTTVTRKKAQA